MGIWLRRLIAGWKESDFEATPYVFKDDREFVVELLEKKKANIYRSFIEYARSDSFGNDKDKSLHLGLLPQPYIGDIGKASIFVLMLNPGLSPSDYYAEEHSAELRAARIRNSRQEGRDDYPFIFLNPQFAWHPGFQYFHERFDQIATAIKATTGKPYPEALRLLAQNVACLELMPYHSKSFGSHALMGKLPSTKAMLAFVQNELLERAQRKDEVTIIVTRGVRSWGLPKHKNVILYKGGETRTAHLTAESIRRVIERLGL